MNTLPNLWATVELTTHFYLRGAGRWIPFDGYGPRNLHTLPGCLAPHPIARMNDVCE